MKKAYEQPELSVVVLDSFDIITTSACGGAGGGSETEFDSI